MASKYKILYVDDEVDNLNVLKLTFRNEFHVTVESSPLKGLELIRNEEFQIIVVDQRMPEMTGVELLEEAMKIQKDAVRILLTGYSDIQATINAVNKGKIFYYLSKPWKKEEVMGILLKAIDHYELTKKNKELVLRLSRSVNELQIFLYRASHDLKAPITSQLGLLNLLRDEVTGESKIYIHKIEEVISRLEKTIDKIRALSDLGYDFVNKNYSTNLTKIIEAILSKWQDQLHGKGIKVRLNISSSSDFNFEVSLIEIILDQVIENSIHFVKPHEPEKWIEVNSVIKKETDSMEIIVSDNGIGIDPKFIPEVTDPFFKGTTVSTGNGLGLYIVKRVCDLMQGKIEIFSDGIAGTTVKVTLPNLKAEAPNGMVSELSVLKA